MKIRYFDKLFLASALLLTVLLSWGDTLFREVMASGLGLTFSGLVIINFFVVLLEINKY